MQLKLLFNVALVVLMFVWLASCGGSGGNDSSSGSTSSSSSSGSSSSSSGSSSSSSSNSSSSGSNSISSSSGSGAIGEVDTGVPTGPIVSFSNDDGDSAWNTVGRSLSDAYGYAQTFALNSGWTQTNSEWVIERVGNGFDIANHGYEHNAGGTDSNVRDTKRLFDDMGIPLGGFIGPNNIWGHDEANVVKNYHHYYSTRWTEDGITTPYDIFHLPRCGLNNSRTATQITEKLERVVNENRWIIFSGHSMSGTWPDPSDTWGQDQALLEFVLSEIQRLGIPVRPIRDVVNEYHPQGGVIDCSSNDHQEPDLDYFEEAQSLDTGSWNEYWQNLNGSGPGYFGGPVVYYHTSNNSLPVMKFHRLVADGDYRVRADLIPYDTNQTYRVYYSFNESNPSEHSIDISGKTDADLGVVTITDGEFSLYTQNVDVVPLGDPDGFVGWAFIRLYAQFPKGHISGSIRNSNSDEIEGAIVEAKQGQTVIGRAISNAGGVYQIILPVGVYELSVNASGYSEYSRGNNNIGSGQIVTHNVQLSN